MKTPSLAGQASRFRQARWTPGIHYGCAAITELSSNAAISPFWSVIRPHSSSGIGETRCGTAIASRRMQFAMERTQ